MFNSLVGDERIELSTSATRTQRSTDELVPVVEARFCLLLHSKECSYDLTTGFSSQDSFRILDKKQLALINVKIQSNLKK